MHTHTLAFVCMGVYVCMYVWERETRTKEEPTETRKEKGTNRPLFNLLERLQGTIFCAINSPFHLLQQYSSSPAINK
jgi:hypothetical protein